MTRINFPRDSKVNHPIWFSFFATRPLTCGTCYTFHFPSCRSKCSPKVCNFPSSGAILNLEIEYSYIPYVQVTPIVIPRLSGGGLLPRARARPRDMAFNRSRGQSLSSLTILGDNDTYINITPVSAVYAFGRRDIPAGIVGRSVERSTRCRTCLLYLPAKPKNVRSSRSLSRFTSSPSPAVNIHY